MSLTINIDTTEANSAIAELKENIKTCHEALKLFKSDLATLDYDKFLQSMFKFYLNSGKIQELFLSFINKIKEVKQV
jgi:hypothetical protein